MAPFNRAANADTSTSVVWETTGSGLQPFVLQSLSFDFDVMSVLLAVLTHHAVSILV